MKVVWILPKWPYPDNDGAKKAHMALLKNWPKEYPLDLVVFSNDIKTQDEIHTLQKLIGFNNLLVLPYSRLSNALLFLLSLFSIHSLPATVKRFVTKRALSLWNAWSKSRQWDVLILDGLHAAGLVFDASKKRAFSKAQILCLRAHNVESELWEQAQMRAPVFYKWVYKKEKKRMQAFEKSVIAQCDVLVPVSDVDSDKFTLLNDNVVTHVAPIGMDWARPPHAVEVSQTIELLFIGRMDWLPNRQGLEWFLKEVWPFLTANKALRLHVVGSHASPELIKRMLNSSNVIYHAEVPEVDSYYDQVALTIIPILIGSGTRVKAIESARYGRSFISTAKGIEGIALRSGVDFIEANSKDEWISALNALTGDKCVRLGQAIHANLKQTYDKKTIQNDFVALLSTLLKSKH